MNYQDFQIIVDKNNNIRASSEQGEVSGELRLDINRTKQTCLLIEHQVKDAQLLKGLGRELYQALFPDKINSRFHATMASAQANKYSVRLRLIFQSPELASLPWEFLYDEDTNIFLGNNTETVLSRYIDVPLQKRDIKAASLPLKVLLVISTPTNLAKLDVAGEEKLIREALGKHIEAGNIELDVLQEASIRNINQKLREKSYNVFHFIGHGVFENNQGFIALEDNNGKSQLLDDERFANFFLGNSNVGLVVLNSCQGAAVGSNQVFAGTAPNLVRRGIPAVVAMQYSIFDNTAKIFADEFYRTLALGYPVDEAIQTTRNAISMEVGLDKRDFATPVLYMRASDGIILDVKEKEDINSNSIITSIKPTNSLEELGFLFEMIDAHPEAKLSELAEMSGLSLAADYIGADFSYEDLSLDDLSNANFSNANFSNANLSYTNLSNANLSNANFSNANLSYTNLSNANLDYANMSNVNLNNTNFNGAKSSTIDLNSIKSNNT